MVRYSILTVFILAIGCYAQVTVTNSGFATTPGLAYPAVPVSPPILYAPIVHLGPSPTQAVQATAAPGGIGIEPLTIPGETVEYQSQPTSNANNGQANPNLFKFGAAQFRSYSDFPGTGLDLDGNGKSLAEIAREQRQRETTVNVRVFTNSNIDQLNQAGNSVSTPSARSNYTSDNWSPNNGVITPENSELAQNAVGAPAQENQQMPTGNRSPFAPKSHSQSYSPAGIAAPPNQPQAEVRPFAKREGVEIARNNPRNAPLAQSQQALSSGQNTPVQKNQPQAKLLPGTASRLPLVGIAGLFSVSLGIFVRYQRSKAK
jgi:hypothetical protein